MTRIAKRMRKIEPFHVMDLMSRAAELEAAGQSIVHFEVGEPDFPTAAPILKAAQGFLSGGHVHYTSALGLPELRRAISGHYAARYDIEVAPDRIVITAGASGALLLALGVLVEPGDEWLIPDPGYPCNRHFVRLLEGHPIALPVDASCNFQPSADMVANAWATNTRGVMIASPANPTGSLIPHEQLSAIAEAVSSRGGTLLVDEIYHGLTYGVDARTALAISDEVFVINSFSKYFGMTGWRLGWIVVPERYVREIEKLAQNVYIAPSTVAQHAALAAFGAESVEIFEHRRGEFRTRRDLLLPGLQALGFRLATAPEGAFYLYADCSELADDSEELAIRLLTKAGVAATPGLDFGDNSPRRHIRFAYTVGLEQISEGLRRMGQLFT